MACAFATFLPFTAFAGGKKATPTIALSANAEQQNLSWAINKDWQSATLRIGSPNIDAFSIDFDLSQPISFSILDIDGNKLPDGLYTWELKVNTEALQTRQETAPDAGSSTNEQGLSASGVVSILNGSFVIPKSTGVDSDTPSALKDQVFSDDLIVQGSIATGFDAVNGESFGFDTIRLKENNLRIHFQDTSVSASFPTRDWRILINDTGNGGGNYFGIEDTDAGTIPFRVEAGAGNHALYVDNGGEVGFGTSTPVVELHSVSGDTPTLRLEQDGSSGFTAQSWDLGSNETNFFIRDASNSSRIPFKIKPAAPTNALFVDVDGDIGLGTQSPDSRLDIEDAVPALRFTNTTANSTWDLSTSSTGVGVASTSTSGTVLEVSASSDPAIVFRDRDEGAAWSMTAKGGDELFEVTNPDGDVSWSITVDGDLTIPGSLTAAGTIYPSDFNIKNNIVPVDSKDMFKRVAEMPISTWTYNSDKKGTRHMGPMSQDFKAAFNLGDKDTAINVVDAGGVALAAIQGIDQVIKEKDAKIEALEMKQKRMEQQLQTLLKEVQSMKEKN